MLAAISSLAGPVELVPARGVAARLGDLARASGPKRCWRRTAARRRPPPRALASSPSGWTIVWTPIGASRTGAGISVPSTVAPRSRSVTSRSIRGTIRQRRNASRFASHRVLAAGAGADVVGRPRLHRLDRRSLQLGQRDRQRRLLAGQPARVDLPVVVGELGHAGEPQGSRGVRAQVQIDDDVSSGVSVTCCQV